jgi:hypothetical protein
MKDNSLKGKSMVQECIDGILEILTQVVFVMISVKD